MEFNRVFYWKKYHFLDSIIKLRKIEFQKIIPIFFLWNLTLKLIRNEFIIKMEILN